MVEGSRDKLIEGRASKRIRAAVVLSISVLVFFLKSQKAESGMDRSVPLFSAAITQYANYLYLSDLFGKPTALLPQGKFCADTLGLDQIRALKSSLNSIIQRDYWKFLCEPVMPSMIKHNMDGTFDLRLRYIKLFESRTWIKKFEAAVLTKNINVQPLLSTDRQLELVQHYTPGGKYNYFRLFQSANNIKFILGQVNKISERIVERDADKDGDIIGEIDFSGR